MAESGIPTKAAAALARAAAAIAETDRFLDFLLIVRTEDEAGDAIWSLTNASPEHAIRMSADAAQRAFLRTEEVDGHG